MGALITHPRAVYICKHASHGRIINSTLIAFIPMSTILYLSMNLTTLLVAFYFRCLELHNNSFLERFTHLFVRQSYRERGRHTPTHKKRKLRERFCFFSILSFMLKMAAKVSAGPGWALEHGTPSRSPTWLSGLSSSTGVTAWKWRSWDATEHSYGMTRTPQVAV